MQAKIVELLEQHLKLPLSIIHFSQALPAVIEKLCLLCGAVHSLIDLVIIQCVNWN